jgi:DNA invertase Pin-like site-specific DNA recombinase
MIAAIYARKSTEQNDVADGQKSVARQLDHARESATRKGWTVEDCFVFVDDGISGAEFANRPCFLRLMNALKPRAPFQALVMSEESRLGRDRSKSRTRSRPYYPKTQPSPDREAAVAGRLGGCSIRSAGRFCSSPSPGG